MQSDATISHPIKSCQTPRRPRQSNFHLLHNSLRPKTLQSLNNLLRLLLRHRLLHHLRYGLDKLLAVHQRQSKHVLNLLDHLGLGRGIERLQLQVKERLLSGGRCCLFFFGSWCCGAWSTATWGRGEAADREVGNVQAGLCRLMLVWLAIEIPIE